MTIIPISAKFPVSDPENPSPVNLSPKYSETAVGRNAVRHTSDARTHIHYNAYKRI